MKLTRSIKNAMEAGTDSTLPEYGLREIVHTLAQSLREMEADGLIEREQYNEMPVRVEYILTDKAVSLIPILLELKDWGEEHL